MGNLKEYIKESYSNGVLDKTVKMAERRKVHTAIYNKLEERLVPRRYICNYI